MSLIEVLVGILLISFGLLGLISLMSRTIQYSVSAEDTQRAALLANEMVVTLLTANTGNSGAVIVDAATLTSWQTLVADPTGRGLPNGTGSVTVSGRTARVALQWQPPQAASGAVNTYVTDLTLP